MNEDSQTIPEKSPCDASGTMNPAEARAWAEGWNEARAVVSARLAAVEALADEWERIGALDPGQRRAASDLRAVVAADPAEWSCRDCGATGSLSDSVTHRCAVAAAVAADPADTPEPPWAGPVAALREGRVRPGLPARPDPDSSEAPA